MTPRDNFSINPYTTLFYSNAGGYLSSSKKELVLNPDLSYKRALKKKYNMFYTKEVNKL